MASLCHIYKSPRHTNNKYKNQLLIGEVQGKWITSYGTNDYEGCIIEII